MIVVVPMAGRGSRFADRGFETPKPLIEVAGRPMVLWALESLKNVSYDLVVFIALKEQEEKFGIRAMLEKNLVSPFELLLIEEVTEGQLCTVLVAKHLFRENDDLLIMASDSLIISNIGNEIRVKDRSLRGIISVIDLPGDRWSFARTDRDGLVVEVAEKTRISNHASTGMYYFSDAIEFIREGEEIIANQEKTKGEYYVIPVYQKLIRKGAKVTISIANEMWDMGTPEAKQIFEDNIQR